MNSSRVLQSFSKDSLIKPLFIILFFLSIFFFFTNTINTISDFWWHISTGRWIWQNSELPSEDPFSNTVSLEPSTQRNIILKGYWLSQVGYYLIYKAFGWYGLIFFKALLLTLIFFVLWRVLLLKGIQPFTSLAIISPLLILVKPFEYIRPQSFSFLLTLVFFYFAERGLSKLKKEGPQETRSFIFLPLIMVVWANLHPGYIVGIAMIGVYAFSETMKYITKKNALSSVSFKRLMLWLSLSVLASCINPNHLLPIISSITMFGYSPIQNVDEFKRTWDYYSRNNALFTFYLLSGLVCTTLLVMARSWRKVEFTHFLLYACFAVAGMVYFRFSIFLTLMSVAISGQYFTFSHKSTVKPLKLSAAIVVIAMLLSAHYSFRHSSLAMGALPDDSPEKSADFLLENNLPAPIFNPYEWGGYLIWKLYPRYKVFIDARALDTGQFYDYLIANYGGKDNVFQKYGINTVVYYYLNVYKDGVPDLIYSLLSDDRWKMVFMDRKVSVIFVRTGTAPYMPELSKEKFIEILIQMALQWEKRSPNNAKAYLMLGQLSRVKGDFEKTEYYFRETLRVDPDNVFASAWLRNSN